LLGDIVRLKPDATTSNSARFGLGRGARFLFAATRWVNCLRQQAHVFFVAFVCLLRFVLRD